MPKTRARNSAEAPTTPVQAVRDCADALSRAAAECCRQHDRVARLHAKSDIDEELKVGSEACDQCHDALRTFASAYERTAADVHPTGSDEEWWHRANALWLASREYLRRNGGCDQASRALKEHGPDRLDSLHMEYELEASALLALKQAADAYQQNRPAAA